jgi:transcriptional regulator with XRE-family HTH domain
MGPYEKTIEYTDDQREASGELFRQALKQHGWTIEQAADHCGVDDEQVRKLTRSIPPRMSWALVVKIARGLGIDLYELANVQGLSNDTALDVIVEPLPPQRRGAAKGLIEDIINRLK